ncbi:D-psicose/D-tagatose/L-ribulose 3-epimerase [Mangrovibacterium marinum]|uniref:D-psicose/D-tagatose/L-ribulose 3-epimerase n=1 Tax=Mangrovibacterium marinum TaxID=1639118 RepID=A0A2T5C564_9BACT|nr:sugar phosphate isomerase/epimerase family protein [Mangrovibacterium marinum]PTN10035.1 D-psicose/D-tagatose/L-ribulose 3-epimerase [Mangrovibacterium marinum]
MPKFGTSYLSFIPSWSPEGGAYAIGKTAEYGFDMLEISLPPSLNFDTPTVKKQLKTAGIDCRLTLNIPRNCHLPAQPKKALQMIKGALDIVAEMEGDFLGGVLHSAIGEFTRKPCSANEREIVKEVFFELASYAAEREITIAPEPINRYESYVLTSAREVLDLIDATQAKNIGVHLDTFHMNIEEANFYDPVISCGNRLKHLHITESDRGMTGEGNVCWDDFFKALSEINYQGPLVLENFSSQIKELVGPTSLWRPSKYNSEDLAKGSLAFMKAMVEKWY